MNNDNSQQGGNRPAEGQQQQGQSGDKTNQPAAPEQGETKPEQEQGETPKKEEGESSSPS
jgi:hypothetical protein